MSPLLKLIFRVLLFDDYLEEMNKFDGEKLDDYT
jgi:hypothetical protein